MGLIFDSSIFIADERGKLDQPAFLQSVSGEQPIIAAVTASELLHGVERAMIRSERTDASITLSKSSQPLR